MMHNGCEVKDVMQIPRDLFYYYCLINIFDGMIINIVFMYKSFL